MSAAASRAGFLAMSVPASEKMFDGLKSLRRLLVFPWNKSLRKLMGASYHKRAKICCRV